ncbi:hypothetical protein N7534_003623 [Penicillium rubens]|jgi:myosin heavy subunit|nr:hypothetical protein N7524_003707 [Penicillium chrysogenum]KAJ5858346.1 hypothetical protein N7534_003623 [Penicillium rubens]
MGHNAMPPENVTQRTKDGNFISSGKELAELAVRKLKIQTKPGEVNAENDKFHILQPSSAQATSLEGLKEAEDYASGLRKDAAANRSFTTASTATQQNQAQGSSFVDQSTQTATPNLTAYAHKAASHLLSGVTKPVRQLRKIDASQLKFSSKIEATQRKHAKRPEKPKCEIESLKQETQNLREEIKQLRADRQKWVDLMASLEAENSKLAAIGMKDKV